MEANKQEVTETVDIVFHQDTSEGGLPYFRVYTEGHSYIVVPNKHRQEEGDPDFIGIEGADVIDSFYHRINSVYRRTQKDGKTV